MVHHSMEYCIDVKKIANDLYELVWNDFQEILSSKKQNTDKYKQYATFYEGRKGNKNMHINLLIFAKDQKLMKWSLT